MVSMGLVYLPGTGSMSSPIYIPYTFTDLSQGQLVTAELSIPQVGDLNLWCAGNLEERFYTGKTRQLHATHLTKGDRSMAENICQLLEGESPRENVGTLGKNTLTM